MNLTNIGTVKEILSRHGFSFSKGLGQNFIINPDICPKIAENGNACKGFGVLEIGTGIGVLTAELAKRADKVTAVEIDTRLLPILEETLADFDNVKIINEDVMKCDLHKLIEEEFGGLRVAVCANLPYYITSPIIMMLLESRLPIESITVMVQKEAAQRLCAKVGTRESGAITVGVNYYGTVKNLFGVSRGSFMPAPNVDSAVIRIDLNGEHRLDEESERFFFRVVKAGFSQRRKTLANSLASVMGIPKDRVYSALTGLGLPEAARIEQLDMEQLIALSAELMKG
ncbi:MULTISPECIES: 16S rRNA (adenine(1518)-N(6)/adenine(1519)-N(6))-dimethyltransferase RsmA [Ruminococcus]|uniref:16S rRNA (adenine(1518)-N(6)/adenine(1519)-N(6))- dimethyltransferase RsmA n=1 Tax=Ruminococcus TaxID=1263 RepID=UPI0013DD8258|nr:MULTISPECIES: 16S rRNA (adenine(1518)-N(6)/adenine(1519)-N(6))-dimethyltransferase RsmA [Ruminococcus]MBQ6170043.1 16S rRNA (adenine(1518)-N(6)/adenine(1519)-N(6))-dimethyltransferase RsmA [Ruminococcus sp.]MBR1432788.1 16S rRNA (adenine(1518)-N(6)/adenine(1519)-N(6))-dimethyltransferase RsmA [Ruminococcus sp.]